MKACLRSLGLSALAGIALMVPSGQANALVVDVTLGVGSSKDNQTDPQGDPMDLSSKFGASIFGTTIEFDTDTGTFTVIIMNPGEGTVTGFGLALNPDIFPHDNGTLDATILPTFGSDLTLPSPGCEGDTDCDISDDTPPGGNVTDGFGAGDDDEFDIGWVAEGSKGIQEDEKATFTWDFDIADLTNLGTIDDFFDVVAFLDVPNPDDSCDPLIGDSDDCKPFTAFWVAHIQELGLAGDCLDKNGDPTEEDGECSDHIGGNRGSVVKTMEPLTLGLFGLGLLGLGALRRRIAT